MVPHALTNTGANTSRPFTSSESVTAAVQASAETSSTQEAKTSYLSCIRGKLQVRGFSTDTIDIILSSWREGTQSQYQSVAKKWFEFCEKNHCDVVSTPVPLSMSFLSELFHSGLSSVLSSLLHVDSHIAFGQLPIVNRFMKGVFEKRPALPRYIVRLGM